IYSSSIFQIYMSHLFIHSFPTRRSSDLCNNHIYETTPSNIKRGRGCPKCAVLSRSGENHFRYNNKLTDEDRKNNGRHSLEYKKRSEEHTSELQSRFDLVCRLLLEKKKKT